MKKELVTIEFRYHDKLMDRDCSDYKNKTITVGIFDTLEQAILEGNKAIDILSNKFEVRSDDKFSLNYLFGRPQRLVTNTCYPTKGVQYFAKIEQLNFVDLNDSIKEVFESADRYRKYKLSQKEE